MIEKKKLILRKYTSGETWVQFTCFCDKNKTTYCFTAIQRVTKRQFRAQLYIYLHITAEDPIILITVIDYNIIIYVIIKLLY